MFESLKKKLLNFLGKEEKGKKAKAKTKKKEKKTSSKQKKKQEKVEIEQELKKELKQEDKEEEKQEKPQGFFSKLTSSWGTSKVTKEQFEELFMELELILLENNVAIDAVDAIRQNLEKEIVGKDIKKNEMQKNISSSLKNAIENLLQEPPNLIKKIEEKKGTFTILFFGINGSGKTTSLAKLAHYLQKNKISSVLVAADTFRAASIEQLETHGKRLNIPVIKKDYGSDPASVAFDAKKYAEKNHIKVVLIDTAGRMYTKDNLMKEMEKIVRVSQPDLKIFVGEAITGNDATEQARMFNETAGIDGIILTKADVDDKGGAALSVSQVTNKPIYFLGMGQNYEDLKPFKKQDIIKTLDLED